MTKLELELDEVFCDLSSRELIEVYNEYAWRVDEPRIYEMADFASVVCTNDLFEAARASYRSDKFSDMDSYFTVTNEDGNIVFTSYYAAYDLDIDVQEIIKYIIDNNCDLDNIVIEEVLEARYE